MDHGTYPYVTSSSCSRLGLYTGAGVPPQTVQNFFGIMKAYSTRVGGGPFPTEQANATGEYIRERGNEYGTTTRRPRRCGWFDAMAVKYSVDLCGITADRPDAAGRALAAWSTSASAPATSINGTAARLLPRRHGHAGRGRAGLRDAARAGSRTSARCRRWDDLPHEAKQYVKRLETLAGAPIQMVSVGPERTATLIP